MMYPQKRMTIQQLFDLFQRTGHQNLATIFQEDMGVVTIRFATEDSLKLNQFKPFERG